MAASSSARPTSPASLSAYGSVKSRSSRVDSLARMAATRIPVVATASRDLSMPPIIGVHIAVPSRGLMNRQAMTRTR
jgi:hypothetical protein